MDISGLSLPVSTGTINTGLELAMLSKILDTAEASGEVLTEMMNQVPVTPGLGEYIDIRV